MLPGSEIKRSDKTAWDKEIQYEVNAKDRFVLRPDIKVKQARAACWVFCVCCVGC